MNLVSDQPIEAENQAADEEDLHPNKLSPGVRFLQKNPNDSWSLGPLPEPRTALRKDLGIALSTYITQQWSVFIFLIFSALVTGVLGLKGGSKRVSWKGIAKKNQWYISEQFLLPGKTLDNPSRLAEATLRAYWKHWFDLACSGVILTFKRISPPIEEEGSSNTSDSDEEQAKAAALKPDESQPEPTQDGNSKQKSQLSNEDQGPTMLTPDQCESDEEKASFLKDIYKSGTYETIVEIVTQIPV